MIELVGGWDEDRRFIKYIYQVNINQYSIGNQYEKKFIILWPHGISYDANR